MCVFKEVTETFTQNLIVCFRHSFKLRAMLVNIQFYDLRCLQLEI